jgi:hypothetical protein
MEMKRWRQAAANIWIHSPGGLCFIEYGDILTYGNMK